MWFLSFSYSEKPHAELSNKIFGPKTFLWFSFYAKILPHTPYEAMKVHDEPCICTTK